MESRTYIYLDFYARCFYPGKFASFIFKYLRGISNWFQSGGEDWGLRMDTRISIQNIFIRNLNVRLHAAGTHTHTPHHTWLILLQAGDIRAIYCQISELGKNTTTRLIWGVQKYITFLSLKVINWSTPLSPGKCRIVNCSSLIWKLGKLYYFWFFVYISIFVSIILYLICIVNYVKFEAYLVDFVCSITFQHQSSTNAFFF